MHWWRSSYNRMGAGRCLLSKSRLLWTDQGTTKNEERTDNHKWRATNLVSTNAHTAAGAAVSESYNLHRLHPFVLLNIFCNVDPSSLLSLGYRIEDLFDATERILKIKKQRAASFRSQQRWGKFYKVVQSASNAMKFVVSKPTKDHDIGSQLHSSQQHNVCKTPGTMESVTNREQSDPLQSNGNHDAISNSSVTNVRLASIAA